MYRIIPTSIMSTIQQPVPAFLFTACSYLFSFCQPVPSCPLRVLLACLLFVPAFLYTAFFCLSTFPRPVAFFLTACTNHLLHVYYLFPHCLVLVLYVKLHFLPVYCLCTACSRMLNCLLPVSHKSGCFCLSTACPAC